MDVCLTSYGHCNYVSGKHACIFYDEVSAWVLFFNFILFFLFGMHGSESWRCRQQVVFVWCSFVGYKVRARAVNGFTPVKAASAFSVKPLF